MGQVLSVLVLPQIIFTGNGLDFQNQQWEMSGRLRRKLGFLWQENQSQVHFFPIKTAKNWSEQLNFSAFHLCFHLSCPVGYSAYVTRVPQ